MVALGDVEDLSANAAIMLKVSVLAAWAELQIASTRQSYLINVVKPYRWLLGPFWIGALRDYAQLRTDPEMGASAGGMDFNHGLGRDVLLPVSLVITSSLCTDGQYYEQFVPKLLHATSISLAASDAFTIGAMDGQNFTSAAEPASFPPVRPEPAANFYIIYGLTFESLVKALGDISTSAMAQVCLKTMQSLVKPQLCGSVFEGAFFDELCTICYRIGMSSTAAVKADMCDVVKAFVTSRHGVQG